jgi:hypothetical protein
MHPILGIKHDGGDFCQVTIISLGGNPAGLERDSLPLLMSLSKRLVCR